MEQSKKKNSLFVVLEFLKFKPYPNIDQYVCVPNSWIILRRTTDPRVISMYPIEDAFQTRERVKRKEKYRDDWKFYMALIKYEAATYNDAEMWIAARSSYSPIYEEIPEVTIEDSQETPILNRKLRSSNRNSWSSSTTNKPQIKVKPYDNPLKPIRRISIKRPGLDELNEELDKKRFEFKKKKVIPTSDILCYLNLKPKSPNGVKSALTSNDDKSTEKRIPPESKNENKSPIELGSTNAKQPSSPEHSNDEQLPPVHNEQQQYRSMPEIDVDESNEVMDFKEDDQAEAVVHNEVPTKQISSTQPFESEFTQEVQISPAPEIIVQPEENNVIGHTTNMQSNKEATQTTTLNSNSISQLNQPYQYIQLPYLESNQNKFVIPQSLERQVYGPTVVNNNNPRPHFQEIPNYTPNASSNLVNLSTQQLLNKKTSSIIKKVINKKHRIEDIMNNISTTLQSKSNLKSQSGSLSKYSIEQVQPDRQNFLQNTQRVAEIYGERSVNVNSFDHTAYAGDMAMNVPYVQNYANSAYQLPQYSQNYHGYLQQRPTEAPSINQRARFQNTISNGSFAGGSSQHPINSVNQPYQFSPSQYLPLNLYYFQQEQLKQELLRRNTESTLTNGNPRPQDTMINMAPTQQNFSNVLNQSLPTLEHSHQTQIPQIPNGPKVHSESNIQKPIIQTIPPQTLPTLSGIFNLNNESQRTIEQNNMHLTVPQNIITEPAHTVQYLCGQPMNLSVHPHEAQPILAYGKYGCPSSDIQKNMVNQSTNTNFSVKNVDFENQANGSVATESSYRGVDQSCQTDVHDMEEVSSPSQRSVSDHENDSDHEGMSEYEVALNVEPVLNFEKSSEAPTVGISNNKNVSSEKSMENMTTAENLTTSAIHREYPSTNESQEIFKEGAAVFNEIHSSIANVCEVFTNLQKVIVDSGVAYQQLLQEISKLNVIKNIFNVRSTFDNTTSTGKQITEERQNKEEIRPSSDNSDENSTNPVNKATKKKRGPRRSFVLPPGCDPTKTQWTVKHKYPGPGITELLPGSDVYVDAVQLEKCKQTAKNYRLLARMLLTEIYTRDALSVCSLTGGKAKAFRNLNIRVRPKLDEYAKIVFLSFLEQHGRKKGWGPIDTQSVLTSIRSKIQEIRNKYGEKFESVD